MTDRHTGMLVGAACGDALGAGHEFGPPLPSSEPVLMRGQGQFAAGEWTDDTAQLIAIAQVAAEGHDLASPQAQDDVCARLLDWYFSPARLKDIGIHSSIVFGRAATVERQGLADRFRAIAAAKEAAQPRSSGGNGALMRTAAVALALWQRPEEMVGAAMRIAELTHADTRSSESCAVWCLAIRAALLVDDAGDLGALARKLDADLEAYLPSDVAAYWQRVLLESFGTDPRDYYDFSPHNGFCVTTVRTAWAAVTSTPVPAHDPGRHLRLAVEAAVRGGGDTDTVACVAGAFLGAMWGVSAVPLQWRRSIFGWPGLGDRDLVELAAAVRGVPKASWPRASHKSYDGWAHTASLAVHPFDDGVLLSGADVAYGLVPLPGGTVDAVVSLCMVGHDDLAHFDLPTASRVEVRLIDRPGANPHVRLVVDDAADAVAAFRSEGKRVLLHCVAAQSRTPAVAVRYAVRHLGIDPGAAIAAVCAALPAVDINPELSATVRRA